MIRVRFAPSPTGELHIGGARTALYNYLFAKKNNGEFILRLEDTDRERYVPGSEKRLLDDIAWLGVTWTEGPDIGGPYAPYVQSERLDLYQKHIKELLDKKSAYYCFCSEQRLAELRSTQEQTKQPAKYDRHCLSLPVEEISEKLKNKESCVVRLLVPEGETLFTDGIHGQIKINNQVIDDQVLLKSDGFPTYHLANVVDDHQMKISHVIRGEEWLPSTSKHVILYNAFGWTTPEWIHLPNVLNKNKAKLSKRKDGDRVWLSTYIKQGYLPEAMVNFLSFLGWHPKDNQEIFNLAELISLFDITRVQKAGAVFDQEKLNWFNNQYIKLLSAEDLDKRLQPFYLDSQYSTIPLATILKTRLNNLSEVLLHGSFYFTDNLNYNPTILITQGGELEKTIQALTDVTNTIELIDNWSIENLKTTLFKLAEDKKYTKQELLWPTRVALTGQERSPDVFEVMWALGKDRSTKRLKDAIKLLK